MAIALMGRLSTKNKVRFADMKNTGGRAGGVGTSAIFLKEFTSYPWGAFRHCSDGISHKGKWLHYKWRHGIWRTTFSGFLK